ncbi:MAG: class I SAM-dependent rRNA methyltransferase [Syntrophobacteraceae bacterium]
MKPLYLHPGRERRILHGHRWVFSNEIAGALSEYEPGSWVEVFSAKGVPLGSGYINPASLISVRLVCPPGRKPDASFFRDTMMRAARHRESVYPGSRCHRLIYGEADGLPGLVVDRYGDVLACQVGTLGMAKLEPLMHELLADLFNPSALVSRNDGASRVLEGLPQEKGIASGSLPEKHLVEIDGIGYRVDVLGGQKTGMYLDQRDNRREIRRWAPGKKVLDLFCYNGAWSLSAAAGGAVETVGVDGSADAVARARENASLNEFGSRSTFVAEDVFAFLKKVRPGQFDIIILDPPAFAKTKSALADARKGYTDINRRALLALKPGGILITCSCSYHMGEDLFREVLLGAGQASGRSLKLLQVRGQALDHPALLAMPETRYLKCFFVEVV